MSLEVRVAELATIINQTLGPDGSHTLVLAEIKERLKDGSVRMADHHLRIDRLEQKQKQRSKWSGLITAAWISVAVTWIWDHVARR